MSVTRITQNSLTATMLAGLQTSMAQMQQSQVELATGRQINKPSDNPTGTFVSLQLASSQARTNQYSANIQSGLSWLGVTDSTLTSMVSQVQSIRSLVVQAQNGSLSSSALSAIAQQVGGIQSSLVQASNTTYLNRPIFGGNSTAAAAYDSSGNFLGDTGQVLRQIGPNTTVAVNVTGPQAFGTGLTGLFGVVTQVKQDISSNNQSGLAQDLTSLSNVLTTMQNQVATVGATENQLQTAAAQMTSASTNLQTSLSNVLDVNLPQVETQLAQQQVSYQAALQATAKIIAPTLLNYLQ
jgi:flagellar hook-associated protein 3 FlgL